MIGPLYWDTTLQQAAVAVTCEREGQISVGNWISDSEFSFFEVSSLWGWKFPVRNEPSV